MKSTITTNYVAARIILTFGARLLLTPATLLAALRNSSYLSKQTVSPASTSIFRNPNS